MKWTLECCGCSKKTSFKDVFDIINAKWRIIGWNVKTSEPKVACDECDCGDFTKKKKGE